jgi:hypothetical protein
MGPYFDWSFMAGAFGLIGPIAGLFVGGVPRDLLFRWHLTRTTQPQFSRTPTPLPPAAFCCY